MRLLQSACVLWAAASSVQAQNLNLSSWTDTASGVSYQFAIQDKSAAPFAMLFSFVAPANITWAAFATGACMLRSPLLVAWPNGNNVTVVARWATEYHPPKPYANSTITVLKSSSVNATHWTANFLCSEGCSSWYGGSIDPNNNNATFGHGSSNRPVATPTSVNSSISYHNVAKGHFDIDLTKAKRSIADWDSMVKAASG